MANRILARDKIILAKPEVTYGTDSSPDGTNALLTRDVSIQTFQGNTEEIDYDKNYLGNGKIIYTGPHTVVSFTIDLAGSGTAGTAPAFGDLLKACKMTETINAGVDVVYTPTSVAEGDSVTLYFYQANQLHAMVGARGTFNLDLTREALPKINFTFTGLRVAPVTQSSPSPSGISNFIEPVPVNDFRTTGFDLLGFSPQMESLSIDIGNTVVYRNVVGGEAVLLTDRAAVGSTTIELTEIAQKNYDADIFNHVQSTFAIQHGQTAGNIVAIASSTTQITNPQMGDSDGIATLGLDLRFVPSSAGNDEFSLTFS